MATRKKQLPAAQSQTAQVKPNAYPSPGPIGNTSGLVIPDTAPNLHGATAPAIKPVAQEKSWWQRWGSDVVHTGLDVVGLIPGVGEIADGANALIYLAEGDKVNAALSAAAMIPGAGMAATGAKYGKKAAAAATEAVGKKAGREAAEAGSQKAAKEAEEAAAKKADSNGGGKDKGNPRCILRPYKPETCKAEGRTGHHVVPDRVFRTGSRGSSHPYGITEEEGLVICVDGANISRSKEHGKIHAIYDPLERAAGLAGNPPGTAPLGVLEAAGAISVGRITGCNPILIEAQLRIFHQSKGLDATTIVRADPSGKIPIDFSKIGPGKTTQGGPQR
ncbi:hypothetical protein [Delftia lacustris]